MTTTKLTVTSLALAGAREAIDAGAGQARDRELRFRKLTIAPGGVVPWHSHADRPALIYVAEGEIHEFASNCSAPIVQKAGDLRRETSGVSHWCTIPLTTTCEPQRGAAFRSERLAAAFGAASPGLSTWGSPELYLKIGLPSSTATRCRASS
jgi:uncharacterized RmlC-like cupin family protein